MNFFFSFQSQYEESIIISSQYEVKAIFFVLNKPEKSEEKLNLNIELIIKMKSLLPYIGMRILVIAKDNSMEEYDNDRKIETRSPSERKEEIDESVKKELSSLCEMTIDFNENPKII